VLVAFGVLVALAVAGVGIALVGGHRTAPTEPASATPPALHKLLSHYAVLRRPQTAADRSWQLVWRGQGTAPIQLIPRYTRLAGTLPGGQRIFLTVGRVVGPELGMRVGSYYMRTWVVRSRRTVIRQATLYVAAGAAVLAGPRGALSSGLMPAPQPVGPHSTVWVMIIPDRFHSVAMTFPGQSNLMFASGNVAAARVPYPSSIRPEKIAWYNRHGRIVMTLTETRPRAIRVLFGNGVAGARFGERLAKAQALLTMRLGPATGRFAKGGACGIADTVSWGELTAFFKHGRFIGYAYGSQSARPPSPPILATARGLRLGQTVAEARRLYGRAFQTSEAQGGDWLLTTAAGKLDGFLNTRSGRVGPHSTIASIQAGPSICAALSP
jgi:hypothetical protein